MRWILTVVCAMSFAMTVDAETLDERAARVHAEAYVLDTHVDTTPKFENPGFDITERRETGHVDLPRLREGGYDAIFWSIYMGRTPGDGLAAKRAARRIDAVHELGRKHPAAFAIATTADEIRAAADAGKIACLMGIEGGHIIEGELAALRMFHKLGCRYMSLTHSFNTMLADSSGTGQTIEPEHGGLSPLGRQVVREMNRLGMMIDVSHVSDDTFWDIIEETEAPIIASHSSVRAVANHPRNMSDRMIRALAENGGVVQINFYPGYIDPELVEQGKALRPKLDEIAKKYADEPEKATAARRQAYAEMRGQRQGGSPATWVIEHIEHVIELVGPDHVGLGADWDGVPEMPEGLEDVSKLPWITRQLLRRGHSEDTVKKVLGGNLLRVMEEVEAVAAEWGRGS